ncbi:hypothetical protein [Arcanobacterium bovis]|uniref:AbiV family abortive infection protein n=1 Tax=Arcanobacterium bovis TaxID=2529275 RepID=A0A4Q9V456_9ACTO|nr:hypothetical protein [Arcanobacterium bovis]TBW23777.1 hypothetical protein EZJ44_01170 [Arcanobacterium bovis]
MNNQYNDKLTGQQAFYLSEELDSAKRLLQYGMHTLGSAVFIDTTREPVLTLLSIGVEKLLKLALGYVYLDKNREWIPAKILKKDYGHDLKKMDAALRRVIEEGINKATHPQYVKDALHELERDPLWPLILDTLDRYGKSGRFYYLDALGDNPQTQESPKDYWEKVENKVIEMDPSLQDLLHRYISRECRREEYIQTLTAKIAESLETWRELIAVAAKQGVLGDRAKTLGCDLKLAERQVEGDTIY